MAAGKLEQSSAEGTAYKYQLSAKCQVPIPRQLDWQLLSCAATREYSVRDNDREW